MLARGGGMVCLGGGGEVWEVRWWFRWSKNKQKKMNTKRKCS